MQHVVKLRDIEFPKTDVNVTINKTWKKQNKNKKTKDKQTKETKQKMLNY